MRFRVVPLLGTVTVGHSQRGAVYDFGPGAILRLFAVVDSTVVVG